MFIEKFVVGLEETVVDVMGPKFKFVTPYVMYVILYLGTGTVLGLMGLDDIAGNYTIVFTLGLIAFVSIYIVGLKFQKFAFFKRYYKDPLALITQFAPLISITFRLFGNTLAGTVIVSLFFLLTYNIWLAVPVIGEVNILAGFVAPPIMFYFNFFDGFIQIYIFMLLSITYAGLEAQEESSPKPKVRVRIQEEDVIKKATDLYGDEDLVRERN